MVSIFLKTITFYNLVQEHIRLVEERMRAQSDGHHPELGKALNYLLSSGGKRIRPAVALLAGGMVGADIDRLITLAAAIELLHTATLVHDDLIDGALFRRGNPTLNAQWSPAATILTGDYIFARAAQLAAETDSVEVMHLFAETLATIVNGEITQLFGSRYDVRRQEYFARIYAKTASMFVLATTSAAILGNTSERIKGILHSFGYEIGMAFQIVDDILDFVGEQSEVGKPIANDLRQGLITLPTIHYLELHPDDQDAAFLLGKNAFDEARLTRLVSAILDSGAIQKAMEEAEQFVHRGLDALAELPETPERLALEELARYIVHRNL
jgi:geranylgeranyl pyrophosphate synthase